MTLSPEDQAAWEIEFLQRDEEEQARELADRDEPEPTSLTQPAEFNFEAYIRNTPSRPD